MADVVDKIYLPLEAKHVINVQGLHLDEKQAATNSFLHSIRNGKVAAVILSGGQGTRLGFPGPKGMYDKLGLPSMKTIFQLHIEKVMKVRELSTSVGEKLPNVPIYIMTSDLNHDVIVNYFADKNYFGYPAKDIVFFEQGLEPCFFNDGRVIIETPTKIAMAPDGNGGIYNALQRSGCIGDMQKRGVVRNYYSIHLSISNTSRTFSICKLEFWVRNVLLGTTIMLQFMRFNKLLY